VTAVHRATRTAAVAALVAGVLGGTAPPAAAAETCTTGGLACADGVIDFWVSCSGTAFSRTCRVEWAGFSRVSAVPPGSGTAELHVNGSGPKNDACSHGPASSCVMHTASVEIRTFPAGTSVTTCATLVTMSVAPPFLVANHAATCLTLS